MYRVDKIKVLSLLITLLKQKEGYGLEFYNITTSPNQLGTYIFYSVDHYPFCSNNIGPIAYSPYNRINLFGNVNRSLWFQYTRIRCKF